MRILEQKEVQVRINVPSVAHVLLREQTDDEMIVHVMSNAHWRVVTDHETFTGGPGVYDISIIPSATLRIDTID